MKILTLSLRDMNEKVFSLRKAIMDCIDNHKYKLYIETD